MMNKHFLRPITNIKWENIHVENIRHMAIIMMIIPMIIVIGGSSHKILLQFRSR